MSPPRPRINPGDSADALLETISDMDVGFPVIRAARAAIFAAVCVGVSLSLHRLASTEPVAPLYLLGGMAFIATGAYLLAKSPRGPVTIMLACAASQLFLHQLFDAGATTHTHAHPVAMVLLHLAAAGASAAWLHRGEAALEAFVDVLCMWLCPILLRFFSTFTVVRLQAREFNSTVVPMSGVGDIVLSAPRRGPPVPFASH